MSISLFKPNLFSIRQLAFLSFFLINFFSSRAQSIERSAILSNGNSFNNGQFDISYSLGETVVGDLTAANVSISQGIQQSSDETVTQIIEAKNENEFFLFPNPASDNVNINVSGSSRKNSITILNSIGEVVKKVEMEDALVYSVNVIDLKPGLYIFQLENTSLNKPLIKKVLIVR